MILVAFLPIIVIFGIIAYLVYMGAFLPIPVEEKSVGPFHFLYKETNGKDYSQVGKTIDEIAKQLKQYNFTNQKPFQIFYPDEQKKNAEVGFIVEEKITDIPDIQIKTIAEIPCLTTTYPWRNSLSFIFGFMKVDPTFKQYRSMHNLKKTEAMVLLDADTIHYMQRLEK